MGYLDAPAVTPFAHRGGAKLAPENTLEAFAIGVDTGCRYIETDVHMSADGELVVFHDATLDRCTDGSGLVRDHTLAQLKVLDAGYHFSPDGVTAPWRGRGVRIPTLREALDAFPDVFFNLEIKQTSPWMVDKLWLLIEEMGVHDRVLVASAEDELVRAFRQVAGGRVPTSAGRMEITAFRLGVWARVDRFMSIPYEALQVPHQWDGIPVVTRRFVRAAHRRGLKVHVWTIDDPAEMRVLREKGVDAIMSDRPDRLVQVLTDSTSR